MHYVSFIYITHPQCTILLHVYIIAFVSIKTSFHYENLFSKDTHKRYNTCNTSSTYWWLSANPLELCLSCTKSLVCNVYFSFKYVSQQSKCCRQPGLEDVISYPFYTIGCWNSIPFSCMSDSNESNANFFQFRRHILELSLTHGMTNCQEEIKHFFFK